MKLVYAMVDGRAKVSNAKAYFRMIELPDGYHPITNDSVWQHDKRTLPPIMLITQGVLGPYGATMSQEDVKNTVYEIKIVERAFKPQSVSKMWMRWLENAGDWMLKYGVMLFVVMLMIIMSAIQVFGGGG